MKPCGAPPPLLERDPARGDDRHAHVKPAGLQLEVLCVQSTGVGLPRPTSQSEESKDPKDGAARRFQRNVERRPCGRLEKRMDLGAAGAGIDARACFAPYYVLMIRLPAVRLRIGPRPPGDLAARLLAAVMRPPLLFFAIVFNSAFCIHLLSLSFVVHAGTTMTFASRLTAAMRASALPYIVAPVPSVIAWSAMIVP